ncbi:MAG: 3-methyladenine DNA glycosylase [Arachnia sp.]
MTVLDGSQWRHMASEHAARVDAELADILSRRDRGVAHPVDDFLFHYYSVRPAQLRTWHPGLGVELADAAEFADRRFYRERGHTVGLDAPAFLAQRRSTVATAHQLLSAALERPPRFGCFGMHEWAMVFGLAPEQTRHPYLPLRFPPEEVSRIVEEVGCRCSHIDAFRFFTPSAKPLNLLQPTRQRQAEFDQPGCLHVNMDLYKWSGKLSPAVSSELLFDTFVLARDIRVVDMQASAYDLSGWGLPPVRVETPEGRAEYADLQKRFAERAHPMRAQLVEVTQGLTDMGRLVDA